MASLLKQYGVFFILMSVLLNTSLATPPPDSLGPPNYAIQFQLADNFDFQSFAGSVLSLRQYRDSTADRRVALSFDGSIISQVIEDVARHDTLTLRNDNTVNRLSIRLTAQRLYPHIHRGPVTAYSAVGITVPASFLYRPYRGTQSTADSTEHFRSQFHREWDLGIGGQWNFGVEITHHSWWYWFVEYGVRAEFIWSHSKDRNIWYSRTPTETFIQTENQYEVQITPVGFTLGFAVLF